MRSAALLAFTLFCLAAAPRARAQSETPTDNARQEIEKLQAELVQAFLNNDTGTLEKHYAGDYLSIPSNGNLLTKVGEIENYRSGAVRYNAITVREMKIRTYGDTAVVNLLVTVTTTVNGKRTSGDLRNTRVWVKQDGAWRVVAFQATRVAR